MILILNNGIKLQIPVEQAQGIVKNLMAENLSQWQIQMDTRNSMLNSVINLKEVSVICHEEDIVADRLALLEELRRYEGSLPIKDETGKFWCQKFRDYLNSL